MAYSALDSILRVMPEIAHIHGASWRQVTYNRGEFYRKFGIHGEVYVSVPLDSDPSTCKQLIVEYAKDFERRVRFFFVKNPELEMEYAA